MCLFWAFRFAVKMQMRTQPASLRVLRSASCCSPTLFSFLWRFLWRVAPHDRPSAVLALLWSVCTRMTFYTWSTGCCRVGQADEQRQWSATWLLRVRSQCGFDLRCSLEPRVPRSQTCQRRSVRGPVPGHRPARASAAAQRCSSPSLRFEILTERLALFEIQLSHVVCSIRVRLLVTNVFEMDRGFSRLPEESCVVLERNVCHMTPHFRWTGYGAAGTWHTSPTPTPFSMQSTHGPKWNKGNLLIVVRF